jgi:hypothetical protein
MVPSSACTRIVPVELGLKVAGFCADTTMISGSPLGNVVLPGKVE